ncbi:hypothetical protein LLG39_07705, partial [bacterium]|nr:hypothetical protein [bacterium]
KTKKETILNSSPSSFASSGDALPFGQGERKEADPYRYESVDDRRKRLASEWLENATEQERADMRRQALESLANDSKPFVRMFVRRNECGELAVAGNLGPEMLLARIGLLLEEAQSPPGENLAA